MHEYMNKEGKDETNQTNQVVIPGLWQYFCSLLVGGRAAYLDYQGSLNILSTACQIKWKLHLILWVIEPVVTRWHCQGLAQPQHNTQEFWHIQVQMLSSIFVTFDFCEPFRSCENIDVHISATLFSLCFPKVCEKWAQYLDIITTMIIVIALATAGLLRVCVRVRIVYRITSSSPPPLLPRPESEIRMQPPSCPPAPAPWSAGCW